jgi:hypothetical protein
VRRNTKKSHVEVVPSLAVGLRSHDTIDRKSEPACRESASLSPSGRLFGVLDQWWG